MSNFNIAIVGAGIGGLTAALGLSQKGFEVTIFEQAPELSEVGAGLTITPNATKGLRYLGIEEEVANIGMAHDLQGVRNYESGEIIVPLYRGKKMLEKYGAYQYQMHRADLHSLLADKLISINPESIHLNHECIDLSEGNDKVVLKFSNGKRFDFDFVIGADGNRSKIRNTILGDDDPQFSGYVAWRGLVPTSELSEGDFDECGSSAFIAPGRVFARYMVRNGDLYNYVAFLATDEWAEEGWSIRSEVGTLLETFADFNQQVKNIIRATPPDDCYKWGIFTREPAAKWSTSKVTLLGDAAHPTTPFMGQGAVMAIEDAVVLTRIIEQSNNPEEIIERYENARVERANFVMNHSRKAGERFTGNEPEKYSKEDHKNEEELGLFFYDPGTVEF
ncbi:MAG: FAD-dependent monooxygenase [Gammaproteobacteria bacterium]|jgi:salicylate hydroxylase|nr:hypothetical protein [Gammaproteobacteria bacterium]MBQ08807.1 hypothetical protein [Gammaproteobacteria bacterium]MDP6147246.1 FAD-dependent monooxygenase [Gammaproteobacteria bacterium]HJL79753.1 FAD-dependent monooxygenase [Gammaproteobacteria bacterium]HJM08742.1 FAD-dependent monooxygenase [Gammaproteobacteria bacterium]|tara:strand:- start:23784 stop:24956 length:1173 start_codon:yes stop_codon:yes gene_type:complete